MSREVVITGVGAVSALGVGARTLHERWSAGVVGIEDGKGRATEFEPTEHLSVKEVRRADRFTQFALVVGRRGAGRGRLERRAALRGATASPRSSAPASAASARSSAARSS